MNISSFQLLYERKYLSVLLAGSLATILILASIGPSLLASASDDDDSDIISGESTSTFFDISVLEDRFIDQDGDGVDDFQLLTRTGMATWTGLLEGHSTLLQQFRRNLAASISHGDARIHFIGTIGDSEPGSLEFMSTFVADISDPSHVTFTTRYIVIEGLAHEGLEGICGGGTTDGSGPITGPFVSISSFTFAFGDDCHDFNPFDANNDDSDSD